MRCYLMAWVHPTLLRRLSFSWLAGSLRMPCYFSADVRDLVVVLVVDILKLCLFEALLAL